MDATYNLDEPQQVFVREQVATGRYGSATDVVRDALAMMARRDALLRKFDEEMLAAIEESETGDLVDSEEFFDALDASFG